MVYTIGSQYSILKFPTKFVHTTNTPLWLFHTERPVVEHSDLASSTPRVQKVLELEDAEKSAPYKHTAKSLSHACFFTSECGRHISTDALEKRHQ